ncbi:MAG: aspartate aminotransferase family protein [Bacteroidia bacterium]
MHISKRTLFLQHLAQTSPTPLALEIVSARGIFLEDSSGKKYMDLISGISVSNLGHCHPKVVAAVKEQADKFMYLMVYGEYIQSPQVKLAKALSDLLPPSLSSVYFVNSGAEATEGALKLAKRATGRNEIICFRNAYHGSTQGALSVMGNEEFKNSFRPLLPGVRILEYNNMIELEQISEQSACVIVEPIQGEAGAIAGEKIFLEELRGKCAEKNVLLIFDEIQTGFGRSGKLFAFEHYGIVPDILLLAKGMGGGMPIGAFIASQKLMSFLTNDPVLGHITTFGGHPVSCAASLACLEEIVNGKLYDKADSIERIIREKLVHPKIKEIRGKGALLAIEFGNAELNMKVISLCISKGVITDWFLFCQTAMRIAPPLIITEEELNAACSLILEAIDEA